MNARRIHAVLAAAVSSPNLIGDWLENPAFLAGRGIAAEALDLSTLWKFAGLATKVRHNGLRAIIPKSLELMAAAELEITIFATYATHLAAQKRRLPSDLEGKLSELFKFLEQWLDCSVGIQALLFDLIRHERALAAMVRLSSQRAFAGKLQGVVCIKGDMVPSICGSIELHEMSFDPSFFGRMEFRIITPEITELSKGRHYCCYWAGCDQDNIQILNLDELGYFLLKLIDGRRTAGEINRHLGGGTRLKAGYLSSLRRLESTGIIRLI